MSSMPRIEMFVNPTVARAAHEMGVLLDDYGYSPRARDEVVAYTIAHGTPTGCPSLDPEDEWLASEVFVGALEPVPFDDPSWGGPDSGDVEDLDAVLTLPPVAGGGFEPDEDDSAWWAAYLETERYQPTARDWAEYHRWADAIDDRAAPSGSWD